MNKGFFVVFLAIVLGAMALIFVNQASTPVAVAPSAQQGSDQGGSGVSGQDGGGATIATAPQATEGAGTIPAAPAPETASPAPGTPEPAKPLLPPAEPAKPEPPQPAVSTPEPATPEPPQPVPAKLEADNAGTGKPPVAAEPHTGTPKPEPATMTPVTSRPETRANPGGSPVKKTVTLVNIGLHFRGNGMVLRIEADAPFSYKTFALPSPDRYVVDLAGNWDKMRVPTVPANTMIKGVRAGKQAGGPRLVLDMQRAPGKHSVTWVSPTVLEIAIE